MYSDSSRLKKIKELMLDFDYKNARKKLDEYIMDYSTDYIANFYNIKLLMCENKINKAEKEMVKLLKGFLRYDDEGNERIYAPSLIAVKNGKILEFDDTRYWNNKKYDSAEEFWQSADLKPMREKLVKMINEVNEKSACTADCD